MQLVYISGPITKGNADYHHYVACKCQTALLEAGYAVINPMLCVHGLATRDVSWERFLDCDLEIISRCDAVLRLPHGTSKGRGLECLTAAFLGVPVLEPEDFHCLKDLYDAA